MITVYNHNRELASYLPMTMSSVNVQDDDDLVLLYIMMERDRET